MPVLKSNSMRYVYLLCRLKSSQVFMMKLMRNNTPRWSGTGRMMTGSLMMVRKIYLDTKIDN